MMSAQWKALVGENALTHSESVIRFRQVDYETAVSVPKQRTEDAQ
jgi:hypothetical protein